MPAAEMKHGPIALIDEGMPVIVVAPKDHTSELDGLADEVVRVPVTMPLLSPLLTSIPLQLLSYHAALMRGQNVDKPRNLAKSVTVE